MQEEKLDDKRSSPNGPRTRTKSDQPSTQHQDMVEAKHVGTPEQSFTIAKEMPYGFWKISPSRGRLHSRLTGLYTSVDGARKDISIIHPTAQVTVVY